MKARNVQNAGAKMTIVFDQKNEPVNNFIMVDDGTGSDISTPLIMIAKSDGEMLRDAIIGRSKISFQIRVEFRIPEKDSIVKYNLYFSSENTEIYNFLEEMAQYHHRISQLVEFTPHYFTIPCPYCATNYKKRNCFSEGKYCSFSFDHDGVDVLKEDLRQICIFQKSSDKWWNYMKVSKKCELNDDVCRQQVEQDANLDVDQISDCFQKSFINGKYDQTDDNHLLSKERDHWVQYANHFSPSITINNWQYRGDFKGADVFEAICAALDNPPEACYESLGIAVHTEKGSKVSVFWIVFTVIILVILNVVIVYCYRRHAKREMHDRLHHEVNSAVSAYFALSEGGAPSSSSYKD